MNLDKIIAINDKVNNGRGIHTVSLIIFALQSGRLEDAQNIWQGDGDKIPGYDDYRILRKEIIELLGCRSHLKKNCQAVFCKRLHEIYEKSERSKQ